MEEVESQRSTVRAAAVVLGFGLFFAALFAQFPLGGTLPGNTDTWFAIALSNSYRSELAAFPDEAPSSLHPAGSPIRFGESSPGVALLYVALRTLGLDDIVAYYVLLCLLFTATATGLYLLARQLHASSGAATFAALGFCCANFTLANIDDCVIVFFGVAALAATALVRYLEAPERPGWLFAAAALAGLQVYFSAYVFLLLGLWLGSLFLFARPAPWPLWRRSIVAPAAALLLYVALAAPFFLVYLQTMRTEGFVTVRFFDMLVSSVGSLDPVDLGRALPDNLLYPAGSPILESDSAALARRIYDANALHERVGDPEFQTLVGTPAATSDESYWVSTRRRAHVGYLIFALALAGALSPWRWRAATLALFAVGLLFALGPMVTLFGRSFPTLLYPLYEHVEAIRLFRVPLRAYFLCLVALVLLSTRAIDRLGHALAARHPRWVGMLPATLCLLFLLENVPFPMQSFAGRSLAEPDGALLAELAAEPRSGVLLHLPSKIGLGYAGAANDLYELNREIVYMNWQTYLRRPTLNGVNGYLPRSRLDVQRWIDALPDDQALDALLALCDGDPLWIVFHEELLLPGELSLLPQLQRSPRLRAVWRGAGALRFEVLP